MSFILPLTIACSLYPALRTLFPDLAWFTGSSKGAHLFWFYFLISVVPMMSMNSCGLINLAANLAMAILIFLFLLRFSPPSYITSDARAIVVFGRFGFAGLCVYLVVLYSVTYPCIHGTYRDVCPAFRNRWCKLRYLDVWGILADIFLPAQGCQRALQEA